MPRSGLNVPVITVLDEAGTIIEADQRQAIRYVIQGGKGAQSIFISGTTGEFNRLTNKQRQQLLQIGSEETRKVNSQLPQGSAPVEVWAGVTAPTKAETLENLEFAVHLKANLAVIAPLAIADLASSEIVKFFTRDVAELLTSRMGLPIGLYDNPEIAADQARLMPNIPFAYVEALSRLPFVVGVKASTSREVLQTYLRSFAQASEAALDIYVGNALLIFEIDEIQRAAGIYVQEQLAVTGVVAGPANLLPREWQCGWQAVANRDVEAIRNYKSQLSVFDELCLFGAGESRAVKLIACFKQGLYDQRIISSPCVAPGTPALTREEAIRFSEGFASLLDQMRNRLDSECLSEYTT